MSFRNSVVLAIGLFFLVQVNPVSGQSALLTVDASQSTADFTLQNRTEVSSLSGTCEIELNPIAPPFNTARFIDMDFVVDDGFSFRLFFGQVDVDAEPGEITMEMVIPGPAGNVNSGNQFDQPGNSAQFAGDVSVDDPNNRVGGSQVFNLGTLGLSTFDLADVQLSVAGNVVTAEFSFDTEIELDEDITMFIDGFIVASGPLPQPPVDLLPASYDVVQGVQTVGDTADLLVSDNSDLSIARNTQQLTSIVEVEIETVSPMLNPTSLEFSVESSVFARSAVTQTLFLYNWNTSSFEPVDSRNASRFTDSTIVALAGGDVSRFVQPGTGAIEGKIRYISPVQRQNFTANIDHVFWHLSQ